MKINGIKLVDAGYVPSKDDKSAPVPQSDIRDNSKERIYPTFYVESKQMPGFEKLKMGEEVLMIARVKLTSKNENEDIDGKGKVSERCSGSVKILSAGFGPWKGSKEVEEMTDEELASDDAPMEEDESKEEKE